jgi:hypothetical protein
MSEAMYSIMYSTESLDQRSLNSSEQAPSRLKFDSRYRKPFGASACYDTLIWVIVTSQDAEIAAILIGASEDRVHMYKR